MNPTRMHNRPDERSPLERPGAAALEFVLVLPVVMVIVVGATDLSRGLYCENVLANAARTGAAYGATHRVTDYIYDDWERRVIEKASEEAANLPDYDASELNVSVTVTTEPDGSQRVTVEATYPFELLFHWPGWPSPVTLREQVSMRGYR